MVTSYGSVWRLVHDAGISFKKNAVRQRAGTSRRGKAAGAWKKYQGRLDPARLVFIDETWAKTNMTRLRGWARAARGCWPKFRTGTGGR